jgi:hypothetical protein
MTTHPVCSHEGSDYPTFFWGTGGREYEDCTEAIVLKRLLPKSEKLLLEHDAGAGQDTPRYAGFECIILLDYLRTQLGHAQHRMSVSGRNIYIAVDAYRLPFMNGLFEVASEHSL